MKASTSERAMALAWVTKLATGRSLAVCAARDDTHTQTKMTTNAVIPRLAERAEGPHKRSLAFAKETVFTSEWTMPCAWVTKPATGRSLAVCAARDDTHESR
jgi:hypothetical protein